jgi:DNA repair protein RecO (recombination protein O)
MLKRTEGIVLKSSPLHGADLIVTYLTKDCGILALYAKSPRKVGSRFGSSLEPLTYARLGFWGKEHTNLPRLTQSDIIKSFHQLRENVKTLLSLSEILELSFKILPEREANRSAFSLLLKTLLILEEEPDNALYMLYYKVRLLHIAGFAPKLGVCIRCGDESERFFLSEGATLCRGCEQHGNEYRKVSPRVSRVYQYLLKIRPVVLKRLRLSQAVFEGLEELIDSHINYSIVEKLNTRGFMEKVAR